MWRSFVRRTFHVQLQKTIRTYTGTVAITVKYTVSMIYTRTPPVGDVEFRSKQYTFELNLNRSGAG